MKVTLLFFIFLFSISAHALEIQCSTEWEEIDLVIKTSESSGTTYMLFLKGNQLEKYWPLPEGSFQSTGDSFQFKDDQTHLKIHLGGEGVLSSTPPLFRETEEIKLSSCLLF
ncbi:MAG: hypothetical protein NXH75_07420 [Halobacteriovoraceae bacterium]|nr:hypothetical protein [Halobacteriovoraceae bacterium]